MTPDVLTCISVSALSLGSSRQQQQQQHSDPPADRHPLSESQTSSPVLCSVITSRLASWELFSISRRKKEWPQQRKEGMVSAHRMFCEPENISDQQTDDLLNSRDSQITAHWHRYVTLNVRKHHLTKLKVEEKPEPDSCLLRNLKWNQCSQLLSGLGLKCPQSPRNVSFPHNSVLLWKSARGLCTSLSSHTSVKLFQLGISLQRADDAARPVSHSDQESCFWQTLILNLSKCFWNKLYLEPLIGFRFLFGYF